MKCKVFRLKYTAPHDFFQHMPRKETVWTSQFGILKTPSTIRGLQTSSSTGALNHVQIKMLKQKR